MKTIDMKGLKCPMPLIETKKALVSSSPGESIKILIDNEISIKNVSHYLNDNGIPVEVIQNGNLWELIVNKGDSTIENSTPEEYCEPVLPKESSYIVVFSKNRIGEGSDKLGEKLVGAMLESLKAQDSLPQKLIFMNSGINLVTKDSPTLPLLVELEVNGVEMISCGTCLEFFNKGDDLGIGRISNMFEIVESMRITPKVIFV